MHWLKKLGIASGPHFIHILRFENARTKFYIPLTANLLIQSEHSFSINLNER